jgi:hypothetical protein
MLVTTIPPIFVADNSVLEMAGPLEIFGIVPVAVWIAVLSLVVTWRAVVANRVAPRRGSVGTAGRGGSYG